MKYSDELNQILDMRRTAYHPTLPIILLLLLGLGVQLVIPILAPLFGIAAFALFYKNLVKVARAPCPRCKEPFGTNSKVVLGLGTNECQNCKLPIFDIGHNKSV